MIRVVKGAALCILITLIKVMDKKVKEIIKATFTPKVNMFLLVCLYLQTIVLKIIYMYISLPKTYL